MANFNRQHQYKQHNRRNKHQDYRRLLYLQKLTGSHLQSAAYLNIFALGANFDLRFLY
jgi:hypothetical protein